MISELFVAVVVLGMYLTACDSLKLQVEGTKMITARYIALTVAAFGSASALAATVPLGDPFHVRAGESVELAGGVKLKFADIRDERCPADVYCLWQGEAFVGIELQVRGQAANGSITTEHPDAMLLAHGVKLLGLYPSARTGETKAAREYVALVQVADASPGSAPVLTNGAAALGAASRYVAAYARSAKQVCADWAKRQLASVIEDSPALCRQFAKVSSTIYAVVADNWRWSFYFLIDDPQMRTQMNESLFMYVVLPREPRDAAGQVSEVDIRLLPCDAVLIGRAVQDGCNAPRR
jgi:hypothetical protein